MRTTVGRHNLSRPAEGSSIAIGTFDGVHLGHRALVAGAAETAQRLGTDVVAITWDRHPAETVRPEHVPPLLTSAERKAGLLEETGLDELVVIAFDEHFSHLTPEMFVETVLVDGLGARSVHVGHDWRFGHRATGDVALLKDLGERYGFEVPEVDLIEVEGAPVTSSRIRSAIGQGDLEEARALLGRAYDVDGTVVRGDGRGKTLGYPTANLDIDARLARPSLGIYAGVAQVVGVTTPAAISVGTNPTFDGAGRVRVEAYLLDFDKDIYGETVRLAFWKRLRGEERFGSTEALIAQMDRDVQETRTTVTA